MLLYGLQRPVRSPLFVPFIKLTSLTTVALIAFAANSVLGRMALAEADIDPGNFTLLRLISGALSLILISLLVQREPLTHIVRSGKWPTSMALLVYAVAFSYGYVSLDTATGALILFTAVQLTMHFVSYLKGQRFSAMEGAGLATAFTGFLILIIPNLQLGATMLGVCLMSLSGIAWGAYTLLGKDAVKPTLLTTGNFIRAAILALPLLFVSLPFEEVSQQGILLAIASGTLASGGGYALWYLVLPKLSTSQAAVAQLLVPALAAFGGVIFVNDTLSTILIMSLLVIISGILMVIAAKPNNSKRP
ncbi:MAG: drug/metabolite transporter (DMT)-like permease [Reinekea sp.]|jgi:drug/metabolite transporter (DMT)-like permease